MDISKRQSQYWIFTINNPSETEMEQFDLTKIKYLIYQHEIGEEGTKHIQGYVIFDKPTRFTTIKKQVPRAHWEPRFGTHEQAVAYCSKTLTREDGTETVIYGEYKSKQTKNSSLIQKPKKGEATMNLKQLLDNGATMKEVADEHFSMFLRHGRAFYSYRAISIPPRNIKTTCIVIYGPTNTGKSKWCLENFPNAYWKPKGKWWDGYEGQDVVVIDEFYGWFGWDYLLRLTDRYPLILEGKCVTGGFQFTSKVIIFTSNKPWNQWYPNIPNVAPLERRFECIWLKHSLNEEPAVDKGVTPNELLTLYKSDTLNTISDLESYISNDFVSQQQAEIPSEDFTLQGSGSQENLCFESQDWENLNNCSQSSTNYLD